MLPQRVVGNDSDSGFGKSDVIEECKRQSGAGGQIKGKGSVGVAMCVFPEDNCSALSQEA